MASFQDAFGYTASQALTTANSDYTRYLYGSTTAALYTTGSAVDWDQNASSADVVIYKYTGISPGAAQYCEAVVNTGGSFNRGSGVAVRVQGSTDCYIMTLRDNRLTMGVLASGTYTELDFATGTYTSGPYKLRIEIDSAFNLTGYLDDVSTLSADDTSDTYATGGVGIGSQGADDGVTIDALDCGDLVVGITAAIDATMPMMTASAAAVVNHELALSHRSFAVTLLSDAPMTEVTFRGGQTGAIVADGATVWMPGTTGYTTPNGGPSGTGATARNGGMIDPEPSTNHGYDGRTDGGTYVAALNPGEDIADGVDVDLTPAAGSYTTLVLASSCSGTPPSPGNNPLERGEFFTIMTETFATGVSDWSKVYVPGPCGPTKDTALHTSDELDTSTCLDANLTSIDAYLSSTLRDNCVTDMQNPWIDHGHHFVARWMHPLLDMAGTGYGGVTLEYAEQLARRAAEALALLHSTLRTSALIDCVVQQGIFAHSALLNGAAYGPNGGHGQGRVGLMFAAWKLLGEPADLAATGIDLLHQTNEYGQSYQAADTSPPPGEVNDGYGNLFDGSALSVGDYAWGVNHADTNANDSYTFYGDGNPGAYARINMPNWHATAWAMQHLLGGRTAAEAAMDHIPFWRLCEVFHSEYSAHENTYDWAVALWDDGTVGYDLTDAHSITAALAATMPMMTASVAAEVLSHTTVAIDATMPMMKANFGTVLVNYDPGGSLQLVGSGRESSRTRTRSRRTR